MTEFSSFNVLDADIDESKEPGEQKDEVGVGPIHLNLTNTVISNVL